MRPRMKGLCGIGLLTGFVMMFAVPATSAYSQEGITTESMISQLAGLEANPDVDVVALRQRVLDRVKSKVDEAKGELTDEATRTIIRQQLEDRLPGGGRNARGERHTE